MLPRLLLAVVLALVTPQGIAHQDGLTVHTAEGDVIGALVSPTVRRFLGIPYAVANRWEAPRNAPVRSEPLNATEFGDSCLQARLPGTIELLNPIAPVVPESEDCLTINIWAPSTQRKQGAAVMFWIYGGGFEYGTSNSDIYNGQYLVGDHDDVLVVSFNYRMNIFGQPGSLQLSINTTQTQNFGLLDIDAAVQWVHNNIAAFGGDPQRIILFGESAGAAATDIYSYMHPNDTIVKGVIQESGNLGGVKAIGIMAPIDPKDWNTVSDVVGCGTGNDNAQMDCMKKVPYRILEDAVISTGSNFFLVIDNITIFSDWEARTIAGSFLKVPLLAGSNQHEGDLSLAVHALRGQLEFTCPTSKAVADRINVGVPTWRYQYQGVFPDISTGPDLRAFHFAELPLVFGVFPNPNNSTNSLTPPPSADELALSRYMQGAWVAFARDPARGLLNYGWPLYDPNPRSNAATLVELGGFYNKSGSHLAEGRLLDFTCGAQGVLQDVEKTLSDLLDTASSLGSP